MPRFFIEHSPQQGEVVLLGGEDARHIAKSLRMRPGEELTLCDGAGMDFFCELEAVKPDDVRVKVYRRQPSESEPHVHIRLYQALPKSDKLDFIVQKAVELGVSEVAPVLTEHCISRPDAKSMDKKIARLQRVALEAAKQAGRGRIPRILPLQHFEPAITGMKGAGGAILLYERATQPLSQFLDSGIESLAVMVGSEGGFSPAEADFAAAQGVALASLGRRILRCETAPVCALSAILYACGEF